MSSDPQPGKRSAALIAPVAARETRQAFDDGSGCHNQGYLGCRTDEATFKASNRGDWCPQCRAPRCLALVRADEPPKDWKDLILRLAMLFSSGHWSWRKTVNLVAIACCLGSLLYVSLWGKLPDAVDYMLKSPWKLGLTVGWCVPVSSYGIWRALRRKHASPGTQVNANHDLKSELGK
jgi:hypothetical protein